MTDTLNPSDEPNVPDGVITPFQFDQHSVRVVMIDNEPWWVLNDVCHAIEIVNPRSAVTRLDEDDVHTVRITDGQGGPERTIVNESGLYELIFVSRKPAAKRFKRWVTKDVLPEIRRTGTYGVSKMDLPTALENYAKALREGQRWVGRATEAKAIADSYRPKAVEWEQYMNCEGLASLADLAQALGGGRQRLIDRLRELGILVSLAASQRGGVRPMQNYIELGWFKVKFETTNIGPVSVPYATPTGVSSIFRLLVTNGIGERKWGALPTEEELFQRIKFEDLST